MKIFSIIIILLFSCFYSIGQSGRLENEYKLSVADDKEEDLWIFLKEQYTGNKIIDRWIIKGETSIEEFRDDYFDDNDRNLLHQHAGIRYRQRFVNGQLEKELIQLKFTASTSGMIRTEEKFDVDKKKNSKMLKSRHPFLKHVKNRDRDRLSFLLKLKGVDIEALHPVIELNQLRRRIYLNDSMGPLATITLDRVQHRSLPFEYFVELEIELNELRYTAADVEEKIRMESFNDRIKTKLKQSFPSLQQDQTPKYNKMYDVTEKGMWSWIRKRWAWVILGIIVIIGGRSAWHEWIS